VEESFDPYRKWLGIPPEEQPPHHYRLLGLELFEEDADVIVNAADARLEYLKSLSKDVHADMAEQLCAQIKEVQSCLLDPAKKAFYDGQLQRRIAAMKKEPPPMSATPNGAASPSAMRGQQWATPIPQPPSHTPTASGGKTPPSIPTTAAISELRVPAYSKQPARPRQRWQTLAAVMLGLVALGALSIFLLVKFNKSEGPIPIIARADAGEKSNPTKAATSASQGNTTPGKTAVKPAKSAGETNENPPAEKDPSPPVPPLPNGGHPAETPNDPAEKASGLENPNPIGEIPPRIIDIPPVPTNPPQQATPPDQRNPSTENPSEAADPSPRQPADKRQPVPGETVRQEAEKSVREIYGVRIAATKNAGEKIALANQIWFQSLRTKDNLAAQYALMSLAIQLSGDAGNLALAMNRAETFAEYFAVDPWDTKAQALVKAAKAVQAARNNMPNASGDDFVLLGRQFAEKAREAGQIEAAQKAIKAITPLAKKDPVLLREINTIGREIDRLVARYQPVRKALDVLKEKPDDAEANTLAGRWTCFESREWDKGLPMLKKSSDAPLAELSAADLATPKNADREMATADAWWDFAQKEKDKSAVKAAALSRAAYWYDRALPNLAGLDKAKADERLKSIAGFDAAPGRGAIQTGNVALAGNGTRVEGVAANADKLLDGNSQTPGGDTAAAYSAAPCEWTITFDKVYQLQQIRFHFYDGDARFYHYSMSVSADGVNYKSLIERNQGQSFRWQVIPVGGQPVKSVKLFGTFSYKNHPFSVSEFEAYCIPPKR
jgi:hypothetical protein